MKTTKVITFSNGKHLNLVNDKYFSLDQVQLFLNIDMVSDRLPYKFKYIDSYYITKDDLLKLLIEMSYKEKYNILCNDILNNEEFKDIFPYFTTMVRSFRLLYESLNSHSYIKNRIEKFNSVYKKYGGLLPIDISQQKFNSFTPIFLSHEYKFVLVEAPLQYNEYLQYKNEIPKDYTLILSYNDLDYFNILAHVITDMQKINA